MLSLGVPKEIKTQEKRVALTPEAVGILHKEGISVFVERGAGLASGFPDQAYQQNGATLAADHAAVFQKSDIIQKVKEPLAAEYSLLRRGQILFCFLHLASPEQCGLVKALIQSGVTAIGYETLEKDGQLPLLAPMSEIAGGLAAAYSSFFHSQGIERVISMDRKDLLQSLEAIAGQYPSLEGIQTKPGRVLIFGGGSAGQKALDASLKLGKEVCVIEKNDQRRKAFQVKGVAVFSPEELALSLLKKADILIGCAHSKASRAVQVITAEALKTVSVSKKKILIDIAIDQGGNFPEAKAKTYEDPVYLDSWGNVHFTVPNIPSLAGRQASEILSKESLQYTLALAKGLEEALRECPEFAQAVNVQDGKVRIPSIEKAHRL